MPYKNFYESVVWILSNDNAIVMSAGAAGGIVRWFTIKEKALVGLSGIVVGALCAVYLSDLALPVIEYTLGKVLVDPTRQLTFSGFIVGLGGTQVPGFIIDIWNTISEKIYKKDTKDACD